MSLDSALALKGITGSYLSEYSEDCADEQAHLLEPDKIEEVGTLNVLKIQEACADILLLDFTMEAFAFILSFPFFMSLWLKDPRTLWKTNTSRGGNRKNRRSEAEPPRTSEKWRPHLLLLAKWGLIKLVDGLSHVRGAATYFAVPKPPKDEKTKAKARTIFNGAKLSRLMRAPSPINLPQIAIILEKLAALEGPYEILVADWRNWFHQVKVIDAISFFFCIGLGGLWWRWVAVPMGLSWSPVTCQKISWAMIVAMFSEEEWPFVLPRDLKLSQPPAFLELKLGGLVTLYLDNFIGAMTQPDAQLFRRKFKEVLRKEFNLVIKEEFHYTAKEWNHTWVEFLGVEVKRIKKKSGYELLWRQKSTKVKKWIPLFAQVLFSDPEERTAAKTSSTTTFRKASRLIGRLLWRQTISLKPLCDFRPIINVLKRISKLKFRQKAKWDDEVTLEEAEIAALIEQFKELEANKIFRSVRHGKAVDEVFTCSDASKSGWGYIIYDHILQEMEEDFYPSSTPYGDEWKGDSKDWHIFIKEFFAAKYAIRKVLDENSGDRKTHLRIIIGIDNTAVAQVLRNKYTTNSFIADDLCELNQWLVESDCSLKVINLRSKENAADEPSRGRRSNDEFVRATAVKMAAEHLLAGDRGLRLNGYDPTHAPESEIRHQEGEAWLRDEQEEEIEDVALEHILAI